MGVQYTVGPPRTDGTFVAQQASFEPNIISERERRLLDCHLKDLTLPNLANHKDGEVKFSKLSKKYPLPAADITARINRVGLSVVPAYQKALPDSDPTKIDFRFVLIDRLKTRDAMSLANGLIFVPREVVSRLLADAELATVLADCVAEVIEKQMFRITPTMYQIDGVRVAGDVAAFVLHGGIVTLVATDVAANNIGRSYREQTDRVTLALLSDAGYDLMAAPNAWPSLESPQSKLLQEEPFPERSGYLLSVIGISYRQAPSPAASHGAAAQ